MMTDDLLPGRVLLLELHDCDGEHTLLPVARLVSRLGKFWSDNSNNKYNQLLGVKNIL